MSGSPTVVAVASHACVIIDYGTGRTELRSVSAKTAGLRGTTVLLGDAAPSWGTVDVPAVLPGRVVVPLRWRIGAVLAVTFVAVAGRMCRRHKRFARMVALACCGRALRPATDRQTWHALHAVRWVSCAVPARWACLEQSTAAAVLLAAARRRAEWRHGVAMDPVRLHAWIVDSQDRPVAEPDDTALYTVVHTPDGPGAVRADRNGRTS